jgi:hypothetical protein
MLSVHGCDLGGPPQASRKVQSDNHACLIGRLVDLIGIVRKFCLILRIWT